MTNSTKSPEQGTTKSTRKVSTAKTITNNQNPKIMEVKNAEKAKPVRKPVAKGTTIRKRTAKSTLQSVSMIDVINKSFTTREAKKGYINAMYSDLRKLEVEIAKEEVVLIEQAFTHIRLSSRHYGLPTDELFSFFGYLSDTAHYEAIRELKMTKEEQESMPWKFRDKEARSKNLERYQALSDHYHTNVVSNYPDVEQPMSLEHLAELIAIAKPLMVYIPKEAKA